LFSRGLEINVAIVSLVANPSILEEIKKSAVVARLKSELPSSKNYVLGSDFPSNSRLFATCSTPRIFVGC
jgi:hypothetical protein